MDPPNSIRLYCCCEKYIRSLATSNKISANFLYLLLLIVNHIYLLRYIIYTSCNIYLFKSDDTNPLRYDSLNFKISSFQFYHNIKTFLVLLFHKYL